MKTNVIMKRPLFNTDISQRTDNEFLSATDLVKAGNAIRLSEGKDIFNLNVWLSSKSAKEFVEELESEFGKIRIKSTGKGKHTWVHPLLFIDIALNISPKLKLETYKWLFDELIKRRKSSGDSYKAMCGHLYVRHGNKQAFPVYIADVADEIKLSCGVTDWQKADEVQLQLREKIQDNIALLADVLDNNNEAVRLGILKSLGE